MKSKILFHENNFVMPCNPILYLVLLILFISSCNETDNEDIGMHYQINEMDLLPEKLITVHNESGMKAQYIYPTTRYDHGILGDKIEGGGLFVDFDGEQAILKLDSSFVFEDLQPRLVDMDGDYIPEIITILTKIGSGASISIYKFEEGDISNLASGDFIGTPYRWLNIAAIDDIDEDGKIEIAYVTTPHIGGDLHIARIVANELNVNCSLSGVSNHKIRSRNLCLSVISLSDGIKTLYLPNDDFDTILGFQLINNKLKPVDSIAFLIDPYISIYEQYQFYDIVEYDNCINAE